MRYHINLVNKGKQYLEKQRIWSYTKKIAMLLALIAIVANATVFYFSKRVGKEYSQRLKEKENLLRYILATKDTEAQLAAVLDKSQVVESALASDVQFSSNYEVLQSLVLFDYGGATFSNIENISFNKNREVKITLNVSDEEGLSRFLDRLENSQSLEFFDSLNLGELKLANKSVTGYKVVLTGLLKKTSKSLSL